MADRSKDGKDPVADLDAMRELLPLAIRLNAELGDAIEAELTATLAMALQDPTFEARLKKLLENEGLSPDYEKEYLQIFAEWRRASEHTPATIDQPDKSRRP
jgi:hypothetical protein